MRRNATLFLSADFRRFTQIFKTFLSADYADYFLIFLMLFCEGAGAPPSRRLGSPQCEYSFSNSVV
jgi:hypothetical protein